MRNLICKHTIYSWEDYYQRNNRWRLSNMFKKPILIKGNKYNIFYGGIGYGGPMGSLAGTLTAEDYNKYLYRFYRVEGIIDRKFTDNGISEHFYTAKEIRKMKLNKIGL